MNSIETVARHISGPTQPTKHGRKKWFEKYVVLYCPFLLSNLFFCGLVGPGLYDVGRFQYYRCCIDSYVILKDIAVRWEFGQEFAG